MAIRTDIGAQIQATDVQHSPSPTLPFSNVWDALKRLRDRADATDLMWINVRNYGAVGDGSTDDLEAIQDALAATPLGCGLLFPACEAGKYYKVSDTLVPPRRIAFIGAAWVQISALISRNGGASICTSHPTRDVIALNDLAEGCTFHGISIGVTPGNSRTSLGTAGDMGAGISCNATDADGVVGYVTLEDCAITDQYFPFAGNACSGVVITRGIYHTRTTTQSGDDADAPSNIKLSQPFNTDGGDYLIDGPLLIGTTISNSILWKAGGGLQTRNIKHLGGKRNLYFKPDSGVTVVTGQFSACNNHYDMAQTPANGAALEFENTNSGDILAAIEIGPNVCVMTGQTGLRFLRVKTTNVSGSDASHFRGIKLAPNLIYCPNTPSGQNGLIEFDGNLIDGVDCDPQLAYNEGGSTATVPVIWFSTSSAPTNVKVRVGVHKGFTRYVSGLTSDHLIPLGDAANPVGVGSWKDSSYLHVGSPYADGAAIGMGYDAVADVARLAALMPGTAMKPLWYHASRHKWLFGGSQNQAALIDDSDGSLLLGETGTTRGVLKLAGNTSGVVTVKPAAAAGTWTFELPANDGDAGQFLKTDGSGVGSWAAPSFSSLSDYTAPTSYTPSWTSTGTAPSIGNGTITGTYLQLGSLVFYTFKILFGSTTTAGTGDYRFTFPNSVSAFLGGQVIIYDQSTDTRYVGALLITGPGTAMFGILTPQAPASGGFGGYPGGSVPITWASSDFIQGWGLYVAA